MKYTDQQSCRRILIVRRFNHSDPNYPFLDSKLSIVNTNRRVLNDRRKNAVTKYVIRPGFLNDSNGHRIKITADSLIKLYGVLNSECVVLHNADQNFDAKYCRYITNRYRFLYPRTDGNYTWFKK